VRELSTASCARDLDLAPATVRFMRFEALRRPV
jgi:hypothetical protein